MDRDTRRTDRDPIARASASALTAERAASRAEAHAPNSPSTATARRRANEARQHATDAQRAGNPDGADEAAEQEERAVWAATAAAAAGRAAGRAMNSPAARAWRERRRG